MPNTGTAGSGATTGGTYHGRDRFDPVLILAQIVLLQACFYTSYLILLILFHRATGTSAPLTDQMLDHERLTLSHFPGWVTCTALLLSTCGPTALAFVAIVGRARRALDFAATLFVSHVIATSVHSGLPNKPFWWILNIIAAAMLAFIAEAVSLRIELREISISSNSTGGSNTQTKSNTTSLHHRMGDNDIETGLTTHDINDDMRIPASGSTNTNVSNI